MKFNYVRNIAATAATIILVSSFVEVEAYSAENTEEMEMIYNDYDQMSKKYDIKHSSVGSENYYSVQKNKKPIIEKESTPGTKGAVILRGSAFYMIPKQEVLVKNAYSSAYNTFGFPNNSIMYNQVTPVDVSNAPTVANLQIYMPDGTLIEHQDIIWDDTPVSGGKQTAVDGMYTMFTYSTDTLAKAPTRYNKVSKAVKLEQLENKLGFEAAVEYFIQNSVSISLEASWLNSFSFNLNELGLKKSTDVTVPDHTIEATFMPIDVVARFYLGSSQQHRKSYDLFIGAGAGYNYLLNNTNVVDNTDINFQVQGGFNYWFSESFGATFTVRKYINMEIEAGPVTQKAEQTTMQNPNQRFVLTDYIADSGKTMAQGMEKFISQALGTTPVTQVDTPNEYAKLANAGTGKPGYSYGEISYKYNPLIFTMGLAYRF